MEVKRFADISLDNINLVLLDLDNTVYQYNRCHSYALKALVDYCKANFDVKSEDILNAYHDARMIVNQRYHGKANSHSRLFYVQRMVEAIFNTTDAVIILDLYNIYWDNYIHHMELFQDTIPFLDACTVRKIPIILVTDMLAEIQFRKIKRLKIGHYLKYIVTSEEAGVEKPDPYIFELAISKATLDINQTHHIVVIGDNVLKDIYFSNRHQVSVYHVLRDE